MAAQVATTDVVAGTVLIVLALAALVGWLAAAAAGEADRRARRHPRILEDEAQRQQSLVPAWVQAEVERELSHPAPKWARDAGMRADWERY